MGKTGTYEVILAEDNPDDQLTLAGLQSGVPCNVNVAHDGKAALELIFGISVPPALILLDFRLPILNGLEILTQLRKREGTRVVPVVIFSGSNTPRAIAECYRMGANSCVSKPSDGIEYLALVKWISFYWLGVNRSASHEADLHSRKVYPIPFEA